MAKLIERDSHMAINGSVEVSVETAVGRKLNETDYYSRGSVATEEKLDNAIEALTKLIAVLVDNNILKHDDISDMISYHYMIED